MREALEGVPDVEPEMPADMVTVRIDPQTGARATASTEGAIFEVFRAENAPGEGGESNVGAGSATAPVSPPPTQDLF